MLTKLLTQLTAWFLRKRRHGLKANRESRSLQIERLSARFALTVEGQSFSFNQTIDTSAIGGTIGGVVQWGDGTSSPANVGASPTAGPLSIRIDYSMDSAGFFGSQQRRDSLQFAANSIISKFSDQLTAIQPTGVDQWTAKFLNPATGAQDTRNNLVIVANEILIFAGARVLNSGELGRGEKGGFSASSTSQSFVDTVKARGQTGALLSTATDFGPWGGTVAFSSTANWHYGLTTDGLELNEVDFVSVASHELMHSLGFGLANSWNAKVSGGFTGVHSVAISGKSPVPLSDVNHWAIGTTSNGQPVAMSPESFNGQRKLPTRLDFAGMQDIGWQLIAQQVQVNVSHTYGDNGSFAAKLQLSGSVIGTLSVPINVDVSNVPPTLAARQNRTAVQGQTLMLARIGQFTDPGFGANQASPPLTESFTYSILWGDNSPASAGNATVETVGSAGVDTRGYFDASHIYSQMGNFTVTVIVADDDGGTSQQQFTILVGPPPRLELQVDRTSIAEDAGAGAAMLTVSRPNTDIHQSITVQLSSSDTSEIILPVSVVIPAGLASITVGVDAIDDALFDGTQIVILTAASVGYESASVQLSVTDYQPLSLVLQSNEVNEEDPARRTTQAEISIRSPAPAGGVTLQIVASEPGQLIFPATIQIPAGLMSFSFPVNAVDDLIPQGRRTVRIMASGSGVIAAAVDLVITDNDPTYWTNPINPFDVNSSGGPDPLDVLIIINEINSNGVRALNPIFDLGLPFVDVNRNGSIDPLDVLEIINEINRK